MVSTIWCSYRSIATSRAKHTFNWHYTEQLSRKRTKKSEMGERERWTRHIIIVCDYFEKKVVHKRHFVVRQPQRQKQRQERIIVICFKSFALSHFCVRFIFFSSHSPVLFPLFLFRFYLLFFFLLLIHCLYFFMKNLLSHAQHFWFRRVFIPFCSFHS